MYECYGLFLKDGHQELVLPVDDGGEGILRESLVEVPFVGMEDHRRNTGLDHLPDLGGGRVEDDAVGPVAVLLEQELAAVLKEVFQ